MYTGTAFTFVFFNIYYRKKNDAFVCNYQLVAAQY